MHVGFIIRFKLFYILSLELAHIKVLWMVVFISGKISVVFSEFDSTG